MLLYTGVYPTGTLIDDDEWDDDTAKPPRDNEKRKRFVPWASACYDDMVAYTNRGGTHVIN